MFLLRTTFLLAILLQSTSAVMADDGAGPRTFPARIAVGAAVPADVPITSDPTIIVRYLGYECSHCVRQLLYLNEHAADLRRLGVRVVATSADPVERWLLLVSRFGVDTTVFRYVADPEASLARSIGAEQTVNDTTFDLHATIVVRNGQVSFSVISTEPYMEVDRVVAAAVPAVVLETTPHVLDRYINASPTVTTIASASDGLKSPIDLDFNRTPLHPNDLWVVTEETRGYAMAIVHNAGTSEQAVRLKKDSRASHFMWRTMGIAMGANGTFGTAQNGEPGGGDANYMFMGPTLWSSDTAVFASRYQESNQHLASHLDMLHQSPWGLGIAHDTANIFWVLDARYRDICRYDFRDPHEVGGTDHRDGIIRRYTDVVITPPQRGRPAHVALDRTSGLLYFVDPGAATIRTLDTRTGAVDRPLQAPPESDENLTEFTAVVGAKVRTVITSGLVEPVGIDVVGDRLLVGDRSTGRIHLYAIEDTSVRSLGFIATGATELLGITVGPDGRIWFVDRAKAMVGRLDLAADARLTADVPVRSISARDSVTFTYVNGAVGSRTVRLATRLRRHADGTVTEWSAPSLLEGIEANATRTVQMPIAIDDSLSAWTIECAEAYDHNARGPVVSTVLVPKNVRRAIVNDERNGTFDIVGAVAQTDRTEYVALTSDVFNVVANDLGHLKTILWNSGSFGELDLVDDAVLASIRKRGVEVFLIADDPLLLRTDLPGSTNFFAAFGCSMRGVDQVQNDAGQRVFQGVVGDPVTAGMTDIDLQLPRLDHHRGDRYVPNVLFRLAQPGSIAMMVRSNATLIGAVRYQAAAYRSIILGVNASRFLDGTQRTQVLDKGLAWLEQAADPDTIPDDPTSVDDVQDENDALRISIGEHPVVSATTWRITNGSGLPATLDLYSISGQHMATLAPSTSAPTLEGTFDAVHVPSGLYFLVARTAVNTTHRTIIVR